MTIEQLLPRPCFASYGDVYNHYPAHHGQCMAKDKWKRAKTETEMKTEKVVKGTSSYADGSMDYCVTVLTLSVSNQRMRI